MIYRIRHLAAVFIFLFILSDVHPDITTYLINSKFSGSILVSINGKTLYQYDQEDKAYQIGSITKVFTAICILKLQEEGLLSIYDNIDKYISVPYEEHITIKQLLTHTSGIPDYCRDDSNKKEILECALTHYSIKDLKNLFIRKGLIFEPGSFYNYSSSNYILLGEIIENVSEMKYEDYVKDTILEPAGMEHTGVLEYPENVIIAPRLTDGSSSYGDNYIDLTYYSSAGGIVSTVEDMNKLGEALIAEKLISRYSIEQMNTEQRNGYGLGWGVIKSGHLLYGAHSGMTYGYSGYFYINESTGVILTVLSTSDEMKSKDIGNMLFSMLGIDK